MTTRHQRTDTQDRKNINDPQKKHRLGTVSKNILLEGLSRFNGAPKITLSSDALSVCLVRVFTVEIHEISTYKRVYLKHYMFCSSLLETASRARPESEWQVQTKVISQAAPRWADWSATFCWFSSAKYVLMNIGLVVKKNLFFAVVCEQQKRRPACASAHADQRIWYSLCEKYSIERFYIPSFSM